MRLKNWQFLGILGIVGLLLWRYKATEKETINTGASTESPNVSADNPAASGQKLRGTLRHPKKPYFIDADAVMNAANARQSTAFTRKLRGGTVDVTAYGPHSPGVLRPSINIKGMVG